MASPPNRYTNLDGSSSQPFANVFRWAVTDKVMGRRRRSPERAPVPRVDPDEALLAAPPPPGQPARLTWLGHASWLVQLDGVTLLIDPVLGDSIGGVVKRNVAPGLPPSRLPRVDASLVTHNHRDHLDLPSLQAAKAPVVAGLGLASFFEKRGLPATELGWWQEAKVGGVRVSFVPSQHWSRRGLLDTNETLWGGFVIEGGGARIYHSGDTAYFDGFAEIGRRHPKIDAALLPIGAYDPSWFMERQHMNPEQAVRAFVDLGAAHFFAMHWGTFKLTDEPLLEPPERLDAEWQRLGLAPAAKHVLAVGETVDVGRAAEGLAGGEGSAQGALGGGEPLL
jgi:L-ascorbate metabolism protein UlaG (beta-lactamase superfamily)